MKKYLFFGFYFASLAGFSQKIGIDTTKKYQFKLPNSDYSDYKKNTLQNLNSRKIIESEVDRMPILVVEGSIPNIQVHSNDKIPNSIENPPKKNSKSITNSQK